MTTFKSYFVNLNVFQSSDPNHQQDQHERRSNIIATRFYLVIFSIILFTLILALWLTPQITKVTLQYPTQHQFQSLPIDAQCPCSKISLSYGQFVSIQARFHQVCSSDFISDRWIKAIFYGSNSTYFYRADFRTIGSAQFRALSSLCDLTKTTILQSLSSFNMTLMISPNILSQSVVQSQAQALINQFQLTTSNAFMKQLEFIQKMVISNQLLSALGTNMIPVGAQFYNASLQTGYYVQYNISNDSYCDCQTNVNCRVPSGIFQAFQSFFEVVFSNSAPILLEIDGFSAGCLPMDSILQSSLQCFYNQTCLNRLLSFLSINETFTTMNISNSSRFIPTSTVQEIVNELMVEEWISNISYENYYAQCAPIVCTYSKVDRHDSLYVLTKIIGSLGGLTIVLRFIIPLIVAFIRRKKPIEPTPRISWYTRVHNFQTTVRCFVIQLNIFEHHSSTVSQVNYQRIATRIYILFFLILLLILTSYTLATQEIYQETILHPTESQFNELQRIYPNSLSCPCSVISILYESFIKLEPSYHQVCSSDMVSQRFIDYYKQFNILLVTSHFDIRANAGPQFQILASLCDQAQQTINGSLQVFLQKQVVSSQIIFQEMFKSQINESIEEWKSDTLNSFLRPIQIIRVTNQGNQLLNAFHNFQLSRDPISNQLIPTPAIHSNCSCAKSSSCETQMGIFDYNNTVLMYLQRFLIPNFFIGCFPVESLLASTLECFYDRQCMNTIESYMSNTTPYFSPLDTTRNTPNETVQSIINRLMVDSWLSNISFSTYYNTCAPLSCTFEYTRQHDIFYLISSILGIFAGLSLGIKILILVSLRFIEKMIEDFSLCGLKKRFKGLFICYNEQQITNRLHFLLLILAISALYLTSSLILETKIEQITKPSLSTYQSLLEDYQNSLQCPCSNISIEYQSFLTIIPRMHQICSSEFVSDDWIDYVYNNIQPLQLNYTDFRTTAASQYYLLASLCQLSGQLVNESLLNLASSNFIDSYLLSSDLLNERIRVLIREFKMTMPNSFLNLLSLIRQTTQANMIMNVFTTNWKFDYEVLYTLFYAFYAIPLDYEGCNCGVSSECVQPSQGMMSGCYPLEALLRTTLQCFYNQTCIDSTNNFQALSISSNVSSQFSTNSTIESILNNLMVEEYSINISYVKYFTKCDPVSCSYSYIRHRDILDITSTVVGLYGGIVVIAKLIVILILKLYLTRRNRKISPNLNG